MKAAISTLAIFVCTVLELPFASLNQDEYNMWGQAAINGVIDSLKTDQQRKDSIGFHIYSNKYAKIPEKRKEIVYKDTKSLKDAQVNRDCDWKILIHGYLQTKDAMFPQNVKNAFLTRMSKTKVASEQCWNVAVVDWGKISGGSYLTAIGHMKLVGERTAEIIDWLLSEGSISNPNKIHLIGQSLGSHVNGYVAVSLMKIRGVKLGRISGLDPAGPAFQPSEKSQPLGRVLQTSDAQYVDVYHCNMGTLGINQQIGHVEFFPNAVPKQNTMPQCEPQVIGNRNSSEDFTMCSHNMCPKYYAWTMLHPMLFEKCESVEEYTAKNGACSGQKTFYGLDLDMKQATGAYFGSIREANVVLDDLNTFLKY